MVWEVSAVIRTIARRMAIHPLPADADRRAREIERVTRMGYRLLEIYRERDGSWWARFEAPARVA